jgi:hypothetical protein
MPSRAETVNLIRYVASVNNELLVLAGTCRFLRFLRRKRPSSALVALRERLLLARKNKVCFIVGGVANCLIASAAYEHTSKTSHSN